MNEAAPELPIPNMPKPNHEKELLRNFMEAKRQAEMAKEALDYCKGELGKAQASLVEYMEDNDITSTAKYAGIGHVTLSKPRLFANYSRDNELMVFDFVKQHGFNELIKPTINANSLSSCVGSLMEAGVEIPGCINVFLKPQVRSYVKK